MVIGPTSRSAATPSIGSAEYVLVAPSEELRSRRSPAVANAASCHAKFVCATPAVVILRTIDESVAGAVEVWVVVVSACDLKSSHEFSADRVNDDSSLSGEPTFATLLKRRVVRLALPPALPTSWPDADGSGVW